MKKILIAVLMLVSFVSVPLDMASALPIAVRMSMTRSAVRTTSFRSSTPARMSYATVRSIRSPATSGSNAALYAAAFVAMTNAQHDHQAKNPGAPMRDPAALATYGVEAKVMGRDSLVVALAALIGALVLLVTLLMFMFRDA